MPVVWWERGRGKRSLKQQTIQHQRNTMNRLTRSSYTLASRFKVKKDLFVSVRCLLEGPEDHAMYRIEVGSTQPLALGKPSTASDGKCMVRVILARSKGITAAVSYRTAHIYFFTAETGLEERNGSIQSCMTCNLSSITIAFSHCSTRWKACVVLIFTRPIRFLSCSNIAAHHFFV